MQPLWNEASITNGSQVLGLERPLPTICLVASVLEMRLLHTEALFLEDFTGRKTPEYAILSHRWGSDEVSFHELRCFTERDKLRQQTLAAVFDVDLSRQNGKMRGKGWDKIKRSCFFALNHGLDWIWIDTCCINKESSAELSEAINSMFKWYEGAAECYAFLPDVSLENGVMKEFGHSEWFSRGWTLQELLAPRHIIFLDADFNVLGSKKSLAVEIEAATGICTSIVTSHTSVYDESVATRMSWAAHRTTARSEDIAYCLLGIFNISMPLLYGEGFTAFKRLQEEIIRSSDDETIFAHTHASHNSPSALAHHPRNFLRHRKVIRGLPVRFLDSAVGISSYTVTNKGVQMRPPFIPLSIDSFERAILLNCHFEGDDYPVIVPIASIGTGEPFSHDAVRARSGVWRIRIHSDFREHIHKTKVLIDHALRYSAPNRRLVKKPFECETIYLR